MSITAKQSQLPQPRGVRRIWKAPTSRARWYYLAICGLVCGGVAAVYYYALKTQDQVEPLNDPLRIFGIIAAVIVLITASYSLRRRFVRGLPGKVQDWLWLHTWAGISAILIAMMHENFTFITHDFLPGIGGLFDPFTYWGPAALFSLIVLVGSGIFGRLLDVWQTRVIARDASTNGVGIVRALEEHILELEYTIERLCAGKSEPFKQYCLQSLGRERGRVEDSPAILPNRCTVNRERNGLFVPGGLRTLCYPSQPCWLFCFTASWKRWPMCSTSSSQPEGNVITGRGSPGQ